MIAFHGENRKGAVGSRLRESRSGMTIVEMAVVILVISILTGVVISAIRQLDFLRTSSTEADLIKDSFIYCRKAALRSNDNVYMEFDLDTESYRAYRYDRTGERIIEQTLLKPKGLSAANRLVALFSPSSGRVTTGVFKMVFPPIGEGEEVAVYIGEDPGIKQTILYHKFGGAVDVVNGEKELEWKNDQWVDNLEEW